MGFNDGNFEPLVLDFETMGRHGIEALIDEPPVPKNYKDAELIAATKAAKKQAAFDRAALEIYLNQIICIGAWTPSMGVNIVTAKTLAEEKLALAALAVLISNNGHRRRIVTFNGLSFDLPNSIVRARSHRLKFPLHVSDIVPKWKHGGDDLMEVMTFGGLFAKHSLDFYCRVEGIDSDASDEVKAIHGADVPRLAAEGQWDLVAAHCRHDVIRTVALAKFADVIPDDEPATLPFPAAEDVALF